MGNSSHFLSAANVHISGTVIINSGRFVANDAIQIQSEKARDLLHARTVLNAMHTGEVCQDSLRCEPRARGRIINDVVAWVKDVLQTKGLWLSGPAGIGKSAVTMSVAERLDQLDSLAKVVGSFFFWFDDPPRNNLSRFVVTIAYRLAVTLKDVGRAIDWVIAEDQTILDATLEVQVGSHDGVPFGRI